mgnify:FL=1
MKFFEAVPDELFSPLASPNRALYADALDVLYTAYREKLKLPEDMLYSMLRSRLEQQLAEATFEGEDIDEDELRDISGRARFLIRKLGSKGWFEKERGTDFREYITVPGYSSRLLELFHELRDDRPARGFSYVFGTYSALRVADETGSAYEKMAAVYTAFDNTQALIRLLRLVYHNVKHYFQMQLELHDVGEVLSSYFDDFGQKVIEAYIRPLKIKDSVPKYRISIQNVLNDWAENDELLIAMANAASTFVSQNYGAGQPERIRKGMREIYLYSLVVMVVTVLLMQVSAAWLVRMVSGSSEALVLENGARYLRWTSPFYAVLGVLLSTRYALQSLGEKVLPLFSSVIEFLGKVVFVLVFIPHFAYNAVILCEPVIWCFMALYLVAVYRCNPFVFPKKQ